MCVKDIGCRMIEKNSNVPRIIDRLELKKLVSRTTSTIDKRETVMALTGEGINILENANVKVNRVFAHLVELREEDATQLNNLLEKMREKE
jgi:DNA-binding MarR family transcriptional regulator